MSNKTKYKLGIIVTHPIHYYIPWYKALAKHPQIDLQVYYCHQQTPQNQAEAGFGVEFDWDIPLLEGYPYQFLKNLSKSPNVFSFFGCDTPEIREIINNNKFDAFIVSGWNNKSYWQAIKACWRKDIPVIIRGDSYLETNSIIKRAIKYPVYRWFMPKFDAYLSVGKKTTEYYLNYGANPKKIYFVPHAVDNDFFARQTAVFLPKKEGLRRSWGISKEAVVFLFAGKLINKKRPGDFVKAIQLASRKNSNIFGLIAGDGPLKTDLEKKVIKEKIPVKFTGFLNQNEISKAYTVSDCLVLPSGIGETWGLVVNEAMASLLPAIVSDKVGCGPDLISPGRAGEIFHYGDIGKLSEILLRLSFKPDILKIMGENAKKRIQSHSIRNMAQATAKAILSIKKLEKY